MESSSITQQGHAVAKVTASRASASGQKSRVSPNFSLSVDTEVRWEIDLPDSVKHNIIFTVMRDKSEAKDQPRLENVSSGARTVGRPDEQDPSRLYIGRLSMLSRDGVKKNYVHTDVFEALKRDEFTIRAYVV